jgi:PAS domain S-box-containing protein
MSSPSSPTILYVDDDQGNRQALAWMLRHAGYSVREAGTGGEALRLAAEHPDLIILDVNLPDVNGFEVCRRIKQHPATTGIPVLHVSGEYVTAQDKTHGLEEGADGYLVKPAEPREVLATIKALLRVRKAEEAARLAARQWQATFDALLDAVCLLDDAGRVVRCNQAMAALLARPADAVLGQPLADLLREVLGLADAGFLGRVRDAGREAVELAVGSRWFRVTSDPVLDERGVFAGSVHLFADLTERHHTEEERTRLLAERARLTDHLRLLLESTAEGIYGVDLEGRCTFINQAAARMLGYSPDELVGQDLHALKHHHRADGSPYPAEACPVWRTLHDGAGRRVDDEVLWRRDGTSFPVDYTSYPIFQGGAMSGAVVTFFDVTDRKRLEEQLRQSQKMEAVGQLAGGVAHDFNNLLTGITGNVALLLHQTPAGAPERQFLETIDQAAWRAAELVRRLLGFSRRTLLWLRPTDLNACIAEVVAMLRHTIDPRITVEVPGAAELWPVRADAGEINQVLLNLCLNARDAMPDGGRLLLETANVVLGEEEAARMDADARAGEFVRLRVRDSGHGIPADVLPRIFEPYFTTKEVGKGTGLGLAMVFGIVKQHQGWIACSSTPGQGTTFEIHLPRLAEALAAPPALEPTPAGSRDETVLLVDDQAMVREVGRAILQRYGYRVQTAADGREAVEAYRAAAGKIDLVVLDLTMPRLSGRDALRELKGIDPKVRVLLCSGYSADRGEYASEPAVLGFVQKPFRENELAAAVRSALDRARPSAGP